VKSPRARTVSVAGCLIGVLLGMGGAFATARTTGTFAVVTGASMLPAMPHAHRGVARTVDDCR
jgi:hypothetical protein